MASPSAAKTWCTANHVLLAATAHAETDERIGSLDFAAAARAAYNFSEICAAALEHYANYGRLSQLEPISRQFQTLFAVVDYKGEPLSAEFGTAMASRRAPDALIVRLIL